MMSLTAVSSGRDPVEHHPHRLRLALAQRLGGEHALAFAGADAEGDRPEGAMGGGVAVAADQRHPRQGEAELGPDDMDDAVPPVAHRDVADAEPGAVLLQPGQLARGEPVGQRPVAKPGRHGMVGDGEVRAGPAQRPLFGGQAGESLRARHLLHQMPVDIEKAAAVGIGLDDVAIPDLVEEGVAVHCLRSPESLFNGAVLPHRRLAEKNSGKAEQALLLRTS